MKIIDDLKDISGCLLTKQNVKWVVTTFAELGFTTTLSVGFQEAFFSANAPCEMSGMILVNFLTSTLVRIILILIKEGRKIMYKKFKSAIDSTTREPARVNPVWVN